MTIFDVIMSLKGQNAETEIGQCIIRSKDGKDIIEFPALAKAKPPTVLSEPDAKEANANLK